MAEGYDVAVVGSGPAGALAAARLLAGGRRVVMLDVAHDDDRYRALVPDLPFSEIRRTDPEQRRYFLGDDLEGIPSGAVKVGAQLTPPRQYVVRDSEQLLPTSGTDFEPMQSLALGGLGAAWGAASFTWTDDELRQVGIFEPGFRRFYDDVAQRIGVSGDPGDDSSRHCFSGVETPQPPLAIDSATEGVWRAYGRRRESFLRRGLSLGRTPLAVHSQDVGGRQANPYFDMDFWSESRRSVFRPRYLIEELEKDPRFRIERGSLVLGFEGDAEGVTIRTRELRSGRRVTHRARRLLLCAGAINSARIALHSLGCWDATPPILCNPYVYLPCLNLRMLGRAARDRRHSLSQLIAIYAPPDDPQDVVSAQLYGYRSLLLFKLVKEMPLPPWAGLQVARLLVNALVIVGVHHSDAASPEKTLGIRPRDGSDLPEVRFDYRESAAEATRRRRRERGLASLLLRLGVLPYARIAPGPASSIHYAGTLPVRDEPGERWASRRDGRLWADPHVYAGDSAGFRFLPAKGLTFTIMANAVRVAEHILRDLAS